jgi:hypothetical protein
MTKAKLTRLLHAALTTAFFLAGLAVLFTVFISPGLAIAGGVALWLLSGAIDDLDFGATNDERR